MTDAGLSSLIFECCELCQPSLNDLHAYLMRLHLDRSRDTMSHSHRSRRDSSYYTFVVIAELGRFRFFFGEKTAVAFDLLLYQLKAINFVNNLSRVKRLHRYLWERHMRKIVALPGITLYAYIHLHNFSQQLQNELLDDALTPKTS